MRFKIFLVIFSLGIIFPKQRFVDEIFNEVKVSYDIVYGNAPDLPLLFLTENRTKNIDLTMDLYEPSNDIYKDRPVIVFSHSGGFITGSKQADDIKLLCEIAAKKGYVAVAMNYRLGLNMLSHESAERAVYRGVQDGSAIVRFLREHHNKYNINPSQIFWWGSSAGSLIGLHLIFLDENERVESTYGSNFSPDLGCIDCSGNNYLHNSKPNAVISMWGALGDLDLIDGNENIPLALFHGTNDKVVPFDKGFPYSVKSAIPEVYGSALISERFKELSVDHLLFLEEDEPHEYYGTTNGQFLFGRSPNEFWNKITNESFKFLNKQVLKND